MPTPKAIGDDGEQLALSYPQNNGLKLITRNLRQRSGEIDLARCQGFGLHRNQA